MFTTTLSSARVRRVTMEYGSTLPMMIQRYGQELQGWVPKGWQKQLTTEERLHHLGQM